MSEDWYSIDDLPHGRLLVRVRWHGREFTAARDRQSGWFTYVDGTMVALPPKGKKGEGWPSSPDRWQPLNSKWTWPGGRAPQPLSNPIQPSMYSSRGEGRGLTDRDYEQLAAEVAEDREAAKVQGERSAGGDIIEIRWWRDITQVRYEPAGEVSLRHCEGRVLRAMAHCGAWDDRELGRVRRDRSLQEIMEAVASEASAVDKGWLERFQPLPMDESDFATAMAWVAQLNPIEMRPKRAGAWSLNRAQLVLLYRAMDVPLSWRDIGMHRAFNVSGTRVQKIFKTSIEACHRAANGKPAYRWMTVKDQIGALRERNRAYRRRA